MRLLILITLVFSLFAGYVCAQQKKAEILLDHLNNPCGVAIQPTTGEIYVSESGAGRVFLVDRKKPKVVIEDFPMEPFKLDRKLNIGPLGITFLGEYTLIVGTGGSTDGEDAIMFFNVAELGKEPLKAEDSQSSLKLHADNDVVPEGDFFSLVLTAKSLYAIGGGDAELGWLSKAELYDAEERELKRFIPTTQLVKTAAPGGLTINPDGHIVVAQMGTRDTAGDSVLAFYDRDGKLLDVFSTGLNDIVALAYGPRRKLLYALDFSWDDPAKGGLYQLVAVDSVGGCEARLVTPLKRPTSMVFDRNGNLYVTCLGKPLRSEDEVPDFENAGQLSVIRELD